MFIFHGEVDSERHVAGTHGEGQASVLEGSSKAFLGGLLPALRPFPSWTHTSSWWKGMLA